VLVGAFDPMRKADDRWVHGVKAAVRAVNRAGGKAKLVYKPMGVRTRFAWKYGPYGHRRLRQEDAARGGRVLELTNPHTLNEPMTPPMICPSFGCRIGLTWNALPRVLLDNAQETKPRPGMSPVSRDRQRPRHGWKGPVGGTNRLRRRELFYVSRPRLPTANVHDRPSGETAAQEPPLAAGISPPAPVLPAGGSHQAVHRSRHLPSV
jgi:hypothetical protein